MRKVLLRKDYCYQLLAFPTDFDCNSRKDDVQLKRECFHFAVDSIGQVITAEYFQTLNALSRQLCEAVTEDTRQLAERTLTQMVESDECLQHCLLLLENGDVSVFNFL
jgi:hypothetical protein